MRFDECVSQWIGERDFLALGASTGDDHWLLVDVRRCDELGRPARRPHRSSRCWSRVRRGTLLLARPPLARGGPAPCPLPRGRHSKLPDGETSLDPRIGVFLKEVQRQVVNAPRGVFLWNLEPYDDVRTPPTGFDPPISTLYSVASGFKPNMILESLGFDARTRVVFFDCSTRALEVKRLLLEGWDGRDFPAFVPHLFRKVPSGDAHYHLWDGATPETLDPKAVERAWERELERWGGERAFAEHWSRYRQLRHEFVRCDVLGNAARLLARVEPEEHAVIWWSNAFFSVWGNWLLDAAERRAAYERWVEELAERNPELFLYGSDFSNSSVNDVRAGEYRLMLRDADCDELVPLSANTHEIRF